MKVSSVSKCFEDLSPIILKIVNQALRTGVFPKALKHATVSPIIKDTNGNKEDLKKRIFLWSNNLVLIQANPDQNQAVELDLVHLLMRKPWRKPISRHSGEKLVTI